MNGAIAVVLAVLFGFGVLGGLALWLGARVARHLVDQLWEAFKSERF